MRQLVTEGLEEGDRVIVSDPSPAIDGTLVDPFEDEKTNAEIRAQARGETPLR